MDFPSCATLVLLYVYIPGFSIALFALFMYIIYSPFNPTHFINAGITIGICALIAGIVWGLKWVLSWITEWKKMSLVMEVKMKLGIGFVGMTVSAIVPRILVFFVEYDPQMISMIFTIALFSFISCSILLVCPKTKVDFEYSKSSNIQLTLFCIQAILFFVGAKIGSKRVDTREIVMIVLFQVVSTIAMSVTVADLAAVLAGNLKFTERRRRQDTEMRRRSISNPADQTVTHIDMIVATYGLLTVATVLSVACYFIFIRVSWSFAALVLIYCVGLFSVLEVVRFGLNRKQITQLEQYRTQMMIGLGGMALAGIVPRIVVHFVEVDDTTVISGILFPLLTFFVFYKQLVSEEFRAKCYFDYDRFEYVINWVFFINVLILAINIRVAMINEDGKHTEMQIWTHLLYFFMSTCPLIDFGIAWRGGFKLRDPESENRKEVEMEQVGEVQTPKPKAKSKVIKKPKISCPKCRHDYSDSRIPRILEECGHTVCEQCADALLKKHFNQHLFCPVCNSITVVQGAANTMSKNYMVMELMVEGGE